jgi:hypothetical protein
MDFWAQVLLLLIALLVVVGIYVGYLTYVTKRHNDDPVIVELLASSDSLAPSDEEGP